jgi:hypothetical protein
MARRGDYNGIINVLNDYINEGVLRAFMTQKIIKLVQESGKFNATQKTKVVEKYDVYKLKFKSVSERRTGIRKQLQADVFEEIRTARACGKKVRPEGDYARYVDVQICGAKFAIH